ncbi:MAG: amidohydrolase family protein [bacterium]|nr:amidohydrolase family protein [bacterium]
MPDARPVLLYGGHVLTMAGPEAGAPVVREAEVLLDGGRIAAIGRALTVMPGTRLLDVQGQLVLPGLVQGHVHLGQTFFRGLAEGRQLLTWLKERIWPLEAAHDDESAYWCTLLGAAECLLGGPTTVQDIGIGPGARGYLKAMVDSRLRGLGGKCLMDTGEGLPANLAEDTDASLAEAEHLGSEFDGAGGGRLRYAINPRFILSCSDGLWDGVQALAERHDWPVHTHALEQREESDLVRATKQGRDEIEYFDDCGILGTDLRVAHGVWLEERHYERLRASRFSVAHCPSANLKLGSGVADVVGLRAAQIPVSVGCDGAACNNRLDAFDELRLAALLQQQRHGPASFSGRDALRLATADGAAALGMSEQIGTLEVGKQADVTVLSADSPELWSAPQTDLHDLVAFSASRAHVRHVFVGGEQLVEDGSLVHLDLAEIRREADRACAALLDRAGLDL